MRTTITACALTLAVSANAGIEHTILHGVDAVDVVAWSGPDHQEGLDKDLLKDLATARLRRAGVPVKEGAGAQLVIGATVLRDETSACAVSLDVSLMEEARLARNGFIVRARSWQGRAGIQEHSAECASATAKGLARLVDDFVETLGAMNPKQ